MNLNNRLIALERKAMPGGGIVVIHQQYPDQPDSEATAAYEAEHGPINDPRGDVLRVFIKTFG